MSEKCRRRKYALAVIVFAIFLWVISYGSSLKTTGADNSQTVSEQSSSIKKDTSEEKKDVPKRDIVDLTDTFSVILDNVSGEMLAGYPIDDTFLMWMYANYGMDTIINIASDLLDGADSDDIWYKETGDSIHVLWLLYCKDSGYKPSELENVYWKDASDSKQTVLGFTGDINLAEDWCTTEYMNRQKNGISDCFSSELLAKMQNVDVMIMNNEFTYQEEEKAQALPGKTYTFRANPDTIGLLKTFGTDVVTLANNHVYDFGEDGFLSTLENIEKEGILYSGAGRNLDEASKVLYFVINGRKIAYVSATEIERSMQYTKQATATTAGVLKTSDTEYLLNIVKEAAKKSDYVITELHWGTEGNLYPDSSERDLAESLARAGTDVIIGGHPHRLQGVTFIENTPVAYSLGNFWFSTGTLFTTLAEVVISEDGNIRLAFVPCIQENLTTRLLTESDEIEQFYQYVGAISSNIGIDADGYLYDKKSEDYPLEKIVYDSDKCTTDIIGLTDNNGNDIDIVGNLME